MLYKMMGCMAVVCDAEAMMQQQFMTSLDSVKATTKKMPISDQEFMTDPKSPLKKSYL